jgi:hypothetical protein
MKGSLFSFIFGGLVVTIVLQAILFASTGLQSSRLQNQVISVSQRLDKLQETTGATLAFISKLPGTTPNTSIKYISLLSENDSNGLLSPENLSQTLGTSTPPSPTQTQVDKKIALKPGLNNIDAHEMSKSGSRIQGQLISGKEYSVIQKNADWYLINLDSKTTAWVQSQFVYETN